MMYMIDLLQLSEVYDRPTLKVYDRPTQLNEVYDRPPLIK